MRAPWVPGLGVTPWAFGLGATVRSLPLFFGAHGFGFPFTLGGFGVSMPPTLTIGAPVIPPVLGSISTCQVLPFFAGSEYACPMGPGLGITPWAFGLGATVRSLPLFFGAHGFGFPFTLGGFGVSMPPTLIL